MKILRNILGLVAALAFTLPAFATRPYQEAAATAPSGSDTLLIDSAANGTRALPWTFFIPAPASPATNSFLFYNGSAWIPASISSSFNFTGTTLGLNSVPVSTGISGFGSGVGSLLGGASSGTGGPAGTVSPAFTGSPTAPTQTLGDSSTKLATDAFVFANAVLTGDNSIQVKITKTGSSADAAANATALQAAVTTAEAMTPYGSALSPQNPVTVLLPPAIYDFTTLATTFLTINHAYLRVVGLGDPSAVVITTLSAHAANLDTIDFSGAAGVDSGGHTGAYLVFKNLTIQQRSTDAQNLSDSSNTNCALYGPPTIGAVRFENVIFDAKNIFSGGGATGGGPVMGGVTQPLDFINCQYSSPLYGAAIYQNCTFNGYSMIQTPFGSMTSPYTDTLYIGGAGVINDGATITACNFGPSGSNVFLVNKQQQGNSSYGGQRWYGIYLNFEQGGNTGVGTEYHNCHLFLPYYPVAWQGYMFGGSADATGTGINTYLGQLECLGVEFRDSPFTIQMLSGAHPAFFGCTFWKYTWSWVAASTVDFADCQFPSNWSTTNLTYVRTGTGTAASNNIISPSTTWDND